MKYKIISKKELITTTWQGGTTTELYIFPENSKYQEKNFGFRISTAQVLLKESIFTSLPNINRELMILDGSIEIFHEHQYSKIMNKFGTDSFKGEWKTSAKGICTDFNIMSNENYNCKIEVLSSNSKQKTTLKNLNEFLILYIYKGEAKVKILNESIKLENGAVFILKIKDSFEIYFTKKSQIIVSKINSK
ncbi:HutD family protein [Flavobacterium sp. N2270]|uniref:HutD family protein n=1 Tax=Flavobacterium sp. N2270 TaxID=2986831 RepID=UPI002224828C|nr:HutD family protein [Flavobacterium sp. N2270]